MTALPKLIEEKDRRIAELEAALRLIRDGDVLYQPDYDLYCGPDLVPARKVAEQALGKRDG